MVTKVVIMLVFTYTHLLPSNDDNSNGFEKNSRRRIRELRTLDEGRVVGELKGEGGRLW